MERGEAITEGFLALAVETARKAHDSGVIEQTFGRSIPVIVHELEYYDKVVEQARAANPPGVADEFAGWVDSL